MKKVLILEDEEVLGSIYKKKLEIEGFEVHWVKSLADVEKIIKKYKIDIVVLDYGLKEEKRCGLDILPFVRASLPESYVAMLSNYSESYLQKKALDEGADVYFVKMNTSPQILIHHLKNIDN